MRRLFFFLLVLQVMFATRIQAQEYLVFSWNDLGMHCANQDFSMLAVLPPYNNIYAQVVRVGDASHNPQVITENTRITYEIPGNTYSVGKTNFWDFEDKLFSMNLDPNIGLTGAGLDGEMELSGNAFGIEGVPITPFTDSDHTHEDPFQQALIRAYIDEQMVAESRPVVPVSNEINCVSSGCHSSEGNILAEHEVEDGFNPADTPILCAYCHASNALGTTGRGEAQPFSEVIHSEHAEKTNDCYKCHPGPDTQCLRGVMHTQYDMVCQDCHGTVYDVGQSIAKGREPWLEEPSCGDAACHGAQYAEEAGLLFRQSRGHGGLYCSACHGSPHAILPSGNTHDNAQVIALQGYAGTLTDCRVCHGSNPDSPGPHGMIPVSVLDESSAPSLISLKPNYPNPFNPDTTIAFHLPKGGMVAITVMNNIGQVAAELIDRQYTPPGDYHHLFNADGLATGLYYVILDVDGIRQAQKMMLMK